MTPLTSQVYSSDQVAAVDPIVRRADEVDGTASEHASMYDRHYRRQNERLSAAGALGVCLLTATLVLVASPARAQLRASRALRSVDIERTDSGWALKIEFEFPIRYLRHTPQTGRLLRIQIDPLDLSGEQMLLGALRESPAIPRDEPTPLDTITYYGSVAEEPVVELQFSQPLAFEVAQGKGSRSLVIHAEIPTANGLAAGSDRGVPLLERARQSIRDDDLDLAIALLTRILELPKEETTEGTRMDAQELIGLTYERRGRAAHAQAEYEAYLEAHPDGPAANRVRQRLAALLTAADAPSQALRKSRRKPASDAERPIRRELFGSLATTYFRAESLRDESGGDYLATNVLTDADVTGRLESERWSLRGDFIGTYDVDVADEGRSDDRRISRLSIEIKDLVHGLEATIGRQRRSDSGVLGRFDGARLAADLGARWTISALAGLPVESSSDSKPNTDTILAGAALDFERVLFEGLEGQLFVVGRHTASMTDRAAIGGELRYASDSTYSFVYLDYDAAFNSLNTFLASGTWRPTLDTDLRLSIDRRNSPVMTLGSALQGQPVTDLEDLKDTFSESEIRDLAEDRTAVFWSGSIGATQRLDERLQVSGDLTVSHMSGTETSGGVEGADSSGPDIGASIQLMANDWLVEEGVGSISLRYFEGESYRSFLTSTYSRFTLIDDLRVFPRLRWEWRDSEVQGSRSLLRPSLEADWRLAVWRLNAEAGIEWEEPISGDGTFEELTYFIELGVRWEF